ncbi:MAG: ASKHA domain-containing protein [Synergistaceae bacterium]|jgi:uncharacterized 2Fe-2S/4Fe-4S cluster protein (DUF4445 family)|nr:ASKHA domain-containing protein [Synergistaceae bacterium]
MRDDATTVKIKTARGEREVEAAMGANLLGVFRANDIPIAAGCGGRGTCGKCGVITGGVKKLACETKVEPDMRVEIENEENSFAIVTDYAGGAAAAPPGECQRPRVAIDVGTTTVVLQLIDASDGRVVGTRSFLNGQRIYGEDVVTRIKYAGEGGLDTLNRAIRGGLLSAFCALCADAGLDRGRPEYICVAGNTTMMYLLLGHRCDSLGAYPFEPEFPIRERYTFSDVFGSDAFSCPVYLVPWVSAYVGGDITAGRLACRAGPDETALLIDMGTNGEMMLWSGDNIRCCSTAAGPAFEGGGIECGTGSIPGAISKVGLADGKFVCETIGGASPIGICGSGALDASACMLRGGYMDESGRMNDPYFGDGVVIAEGAGGGKIIFTQKDIREIQLAKSAIRAGVEIMLKVSELSADRIDTVYLAGGFGQKLCLESAVEIGLIPEALREKIRASGNSSLGGCVKICRDMKMMDAARALAKKAREIQLNTHPDFQDLFMEHMMFGQEDE